MRVITIILLCLLSSVTAFSQKTITGTVSDNYGPLKYATITIKNTKKGVLTDSEGQFTIEVDKKDKLDISYVGCKTKTLKVKKTKDFNIELNNDSLDEIVIIGYGDSYNKRTIMRHIPRKITNHNSHGTNGGTYNNHDTVCHFPGKITKHNSHETKGIIGPNFNINETPIYPNPSSTGYFNLDLLENYNTVDISVVSITGQIVWSSSLSHPNNTINIDLSGFSKGIYTINMVADGEPLPAQKLIRN